MNADPMRESNEGPFERAFIACYCAAFGILCLALVITARWLALKPDFGVDSFAPMAMFPEALEIIPSRLAQTQQRSITIFYVLLSVIVPYFSILSSVFAGTLFFSRRVRRASEIKRPMARWAIMAVTFIIYLVMLKNNFYGRGNAPWLGSGSLGPEPNMLLITFLHLVGSASLPFCAVSVIQSLRFRARSVH